MSDVIEGGLDYEVNVTGNAEARIDALLKKLKKLEGKGSTNTSAGGAQVKMAEKLNAANTRLLSLQKKIDVLQSASVNRMEAVVAARTKVAKAAQATYAAQDKSLKVAEAEASATIKQSKYVSKRASDLVQVNRLRSEGVTNESAVARATGLSVNRLRELVPLYRNNAVNAERMATYQKQSAVSAKQLKAELADATKSFESRAKAQIASEKAQERTRLAASKERDYNDLNLQAKNRILASERELGIKQAEIAQRANKFNISAKEASKQVGLTADQSKRLGYELSDAEKIVGNFFFTFRRLVGILAVFTLARKFAEYIGSAVKEMITFNAEIETAEVSMSGIIATLSDVTDASGNLLGPVDAYNASLNVSREIIQKLRKDALGSAATFEELVNSYQVAVGPGIGAGLDLDQIRTVSNGLAVAAKNFGITNNQLSEEIRSILQGTATDKNTRLAVLFNGASNANAEIKAAKEAGTLYELLTDKLNAFSMAADKGAQSFNVLKSDLQDATQGVLKEGGTEYFDALKQSLIGLSGAMVNVSANGDVMFTPQALSVVKGIGDALGTVISEFQNLTSGDEVMARLANVTNSLGSAFVVLSRVVTPVLMGVAAAADVVLIPLRAVLGVVEGIGTFLESIGLAKVFQTALGYIIASNLVLGLWAKKLVLISALTGTKGLIGTLKSIFAYLKISNIQLAATAAQNALNVLLTQGWAAAIAVVRTETILMTGGLSLLLILLGAIVVKTGVLDKLTGSLVKDTSDLADITKQQAMFTAKAAEASESGAEAAKDWKKEIAGINQELVKLTTGRGLNDLARSVSDIFVDLGNDLKKGTASEVASLEQATRARIKAQIALADAEYAFKNEFDDNSSELTFEDFDPEVQKNFANIWNETTRAQAISNKLAEANEVRTERITSARKAMQAAEEGVTAATKARTSAEMDLFTAQSLVVEKASAYMAQLREQETLTTSEATLEDLEAQKAIFDIKKSSLKEDAAKVLSAQLELDILKQQQAVLGETVSGPYGDLIKQQEALIASQKQNMPSPGSVKLGTEGTSEAADTLRTLEDDLAYLRMRNEKVVGNERSLNMAKIVAKEKELADLQVNTAKTFGQVVMASLQEYVDTMPTLAEQVASTARGAFEGLSGVVSGIFKDALDPRTTADWETALGEFFLDLATQFVDSIAQQLISKGVDSLLNVGDLFGDSSEALQGTETDVATTTNTTALGTLTTAVTGLTTAMSSDTAATAANTTGTAANSTGLATNTTGTATNTTGTAANTTGMLANTTAFLTNTLATIANTAATIISNTLAAVGSVVSSVTSAISSVVSNTAVVVAIGVQTATQSVLLAGILASLVTLVALNIPQAAASFVPFFNKGGTVGSYATGGQVRGYASGGNIASIPRPANIPASDTVPAWLTPKEGVLTVDAMKGIGGSGVLNSLNAAGTGAGNVLAASGGGGASFARASSFMSGSAGAVQGLAKGGTVSGTSSSGSSTSSKSSDGGSQQVLVANESTMEKLSRGGSKAFGSKVNRVNLTGDPRKVNGFR